MLNIIVKFQMGDILNAIIKTGFRIEKFDEYPVITDDYPFKFVLIAVK